MNVDTARQAAELLAPHLAGASEGAVAVLHLDSGRRLIDTSFAEADSAALPVRDILAAALRLESEAVIVGLARPSAGAMPGEADCPDARRLADAAAALGVRLTDLFIFAGEDCHSFRELGLL
ncbi:MAG TPA: JAB domain-containing protein [Allosphingosinicella sp.]|jgi:DNA repair protein RadC